MANNVLISNVKVCKAVNGSSFVGLSMDDENLTASFPMGFHLETTDKQGTGDKIFDDILLLIDVITKNLNDGILSYDEVSDYSLPIYDYMFVIEYFISHNYEYYRETEIVYETSDSGKISWSKTIKNTRPSIINGQIFYLETVRRHNSQKDNDLITTINRYCVYKSLELLGPLYGGLRVDNTLSEIDAEIIEYWISFLENKISHTNNDRSKKLFSSMIAVLNDQGNRDNNNFAYGTREFHVVWEDMVDKVFGSPLTKKQKDEFNPKAQWKIGSNDKKDSTSLRPDTICFYGYSTVYILDAKYYRYGNTSNEDIKFLPGSSDINKQFAYMAYAKKMFDGKNKDGLVYDIGTSAFIIPYDKGNSCKKFGIEYIGQAYCDWYDSNDLRLFAIGVDTKDLIVSYLSTSKGCKISDLVRILHHNSIVA